MSINATDPIPVRLVVCPKGLIRPAPLQPHTTVHWLTVDKRGVPDIDKSAREEGWAWLEDLYRRELAEPGLTQQREAELREGKRQIDEYVEAVSRKKVLRVQLNPGANPKDIEVMPDWALPQGVIDRRKKAANEVRSMKLAERPRVGKKGKGGKDEAAA